MGYYMPEKPKPVEIKDEVETRIVGQRTIIATLAALGIAVHTLGIWWALDKSNELKEQEIKIQKEQLDLARRQFVLDSIAAAKNEKIR